MVVIDLFREVFFNVFEWVVCWSNGGAALKAERCIKHAKALKFQKICLVGVVSDKSIHTVQYNFFLSI